MPFGYLTAALLLAVCTFFALVAPRRTRRLGQVSFWFGLMINEIPLVAFYALLASTLLAGSQGDLDSAGGKVVLGLAVATTVGLAVLAGRALSARPAVEAALRDGLGAGWRTAIDAEVAGRLRRRPPLWRILLRPTFVTRRDVRRVADLSYGPAGRYNLLDVYHHRSRPVGGPVLIYWHGGGFYSGRKNREGRPLLYRLASQGWVCISANYRLTPDAHFPDSHVDGKKVIAWARAHAHEYGADPSVLLVSGSSAGGHMACTAGLTANDPAFQPGFEDEDTSVTAVVSLYAYYGPVSDDPRMPSSPAGYFRPDAPPFFLAHGTNDTLVPVENARAFVAGLRAASSGPVVYAELPGAQHSFDLYHSVRFEAVIDGAEAFAAWVRARRAGRTADIPRP
jgi:acetyl esterase/lipase